jgi:tRNA G18 (ribose-2'-O)-methylase SpoU
MEEDVALRHWMVKKYEEDMRENRQAVPGPMPLVFVLDHVKGGSNAPRIVRTANVLGAREVHFVAVGRFDPSPARGAMRHTPIRSFSCFAESHAVLVDQGYVPVALVLDGAEVLGKTALPERCAVVVGNEEFGLTFDPREVPGVRTVRIPEFGVTRSLNVAVAASVAGFEWVRQHHHLWPAREACRSGDGGGQGEPEPPSLAKPAGPC